MARSKLKILPFGFGLGGIIVLTFVSFIPCLRNDFVHFDDPQYVLDNPLVKSVSFNNIKKIFSSSTWGNYQPLVTLSFAVEYHFFRFNPYFYHLDNLLLHLINTVLVFYLIYLLTENSNIAFFTTILFAIHPMQVESVAWISERKNLLYAFFYFWALIVYILYVKKEHSRAVFYLFSVILFLCSLLSKGLAVSLVMILFAVDFLFKRKLNWTVLKEKIPFLGLALVFGLVTLHFQGQYHASWGLENKIPLNERILAASHIFFAYPVKLIWPLKLSCFYPFPQIQSDSIPVVFYVMSLVACILVYFLVKLRSQRFLIFCFLFFLFNIVWVLQILPMENFLIADRYVYVAGVGLFLLMARCLSYLLDRRFTYPSVFKKTFFFMYG